MGKSARVLVVLMLVLGALFCVFALLSYFIPNEHSLLYTAVWILALLLVGTVFKFLARRWPAILSEDSAEGGPRLTLGRVVLGVGVLLLWAGALVALFSKYQLGYWQTGLVWAVMFGVLLWMLSSLEHRWLRQDGRS